MPVLLELLRANWTQAISMDTIWETEISTSRQGGVEERVGLLDYPRRSINYQFLACGPAQIVELLRVISRNSNESTYVPLQQDLVYLDADYVGGLTLSGIFEFRRFYQNKPIAVISPSGSFEVATAQTKLAGSLSIVAPLSTTYPQGSVVVPLLEADVQLDQQAGGVLTAGVIQNQLTFREVIDGDLSLPPYVPINDGTGLDLYQGLPILPTNPQFASSFRFEQARIGDQYASGQGRITTVRAPDARILWSHPVLFCTRAEWDLAMRFFSSRRGRLLPFWAVLPVSLWDIVAVGAGFVDVAAHDDPGDFSRFTNFAAVGPDGSKFITPITAIVPFGATWRLLLTDSLPGGWTPTSIRWATAAMLCRFSRDSIREVWETDEVARGTLEIQTLIREENFSPTAPSEFSGVPGGSQILFGFSGSAGVQAGSQVLRADANVASPNLAGSAILFGIADIPSATSGSATIPGDATPTDPPGGSPVVPGDAPP